MVDRIKLRNGVRVVGFEADGLHKTEPTYGEYVLAYEYDDLLGARNVLREEVARLNRQLDEMGMLHESLFQRHLNALRLLRIGMDVGLEPHEKDEANALLEQAGKRRTDNEFASQGDGNA